MAKWIDAPWGEDDLPLEYVNCPERCSCDCCLFASKAARAALRASVCMKI